MLGQTTTTHIILSEVFIKYYLKKNDDTYYDFRHTIHLFIFNHLYLNSRVGKMYFNTFEHLLLLYQNLHKNKSYSIKIQYDCIYCCIRINLLIKGKNL